MALTPAEAVRRSQQVLAYAWMVRTFVKHSPEVEKFPELMGIVRAVFDTSRMLESRVDDPAAYLAKLRARWPKLRDAAQEFARDAPLASDHTNFKQAVVAMDGCVDDLAAILAEFPAPIPPSIPRSFLPVVPSGTLSQCSTDEPPTT